MKDGCQTYKALCLACLGVQDLLRIAMSLLLCCLVTTRKSALLSANDVGFLDCTCTCTNKLVQCIALNVQWYLKLNVKSHTILFLCLLLLLLLTLTLTLLLIPHFRLKWIGCPYQHKQMKNRYAFQIGSCIYNILQRIDVQSVTYYTICCIDIQMLSSHDYGHDEAPLR